MEGSIMADLRASGLGGVPKGETADRPSSPSIGDVFYNGTLGCLEIYTSQGWVANSAPPGIPTIGTATYSATNKAYNNASASIAFTPGEGGGLPNSYRATSTPGGFTGTAASSPITVSGLQSATAYTFSVTGTNNFGTSAGSINSNSITANTVPQAPTISSAVANGASGQVSVAFSANATGGSSITGYTITSSPGNITATGSSSPIVVSGLTNGTSYTFTATATNANGTSAASSASSSVTPNILAEYLVVAGGGGGAAGRASSSWWNGGGGGAGGLRTGTVTVNASSQYNILVGAGGTGQIAGTNHQTSTGTIGVNSSAFDIASSGGGSGGSYIDGDTSSGRPGGSGGGQGGGGSAQGTGGAATPTGQGNNGGSGIDGAAPGGGAAGGGGGAGAVGGNGVSGQSGAGGIGLQSSITGTSTYYAGGGGGGGIDNSNYLVTRGLGGLGGGGNGRVTGTTPGDAGSANTGGGGGGVGGGEGNIINSGGAGGSGIVIVSVVAAAASTTGSPTYTTSGGRHIYQFTGTGSITF
jgi:hypothetical protein